MDGNNPGPLVASAFVMCSRFRKVFKNENISFAIESLQSSGYCGRAYLLYIIQFISSLKILLFFFFFLN